MTIVAAPIRILDIAVLLNAVLVRLVLIPTLLRVFRRYTWTLPRWLNRILPEVRFGHGQAAARPGVEVVPAAERSP